MPEPNGPSSTDAQKVQKRRIAPDEAGQRVDNFLLKVLKGVPKTHIYKILRSGEVRVDGRRVKPSDRLEEGDLVRIPPIRTRREADIRPQAGLIERLLKAVIFEDEDFLAVNKPVGIAVHGGSGVSSGVVEQLRLGLQLPRLELVHRLDRGTSGCLLLAKRRKSLQMAQAAFRQRAVKKRYLAQVWGHWPEELRVIQHRLERYTTQSGERRVRVSHQGQPARTDFEVVARSPHATQLKIALHTGRTHQIRVHAAHSGFPLVGDDKYAHHQPPAYRLALHAQRLVLQLPDRALRLEAPTGEAWSKLWSLLCQETLPSLEADLVEQVKQRNHR